MNEVKYPLVIKITGINYLKFYPLNILPSNSYSSKQDNLLPKFAKHKLFNEKDTFTAVKLRAYCSSVEVGEILNEHYTSKFLAHLCTKCKVSYNRSHFVRRPSVVRRAPSTFQLVTTLQATFCIQSS